MSSERELFNKQLQQLMFVVRDVLGKQIVGAYLHGSAVLGGIRPRSDIDVLAVSSRPTTPDEKHLLIERLMAITGVTDPGPPWTVELTIVVESGRLRTPLPTEKPLQFNGCVPSSCQGFNP